MRKLVHPHRRLRNAHPVDVWRALYALAMRDMLKHPGPTLYYSPHEIAAVMFRNFNDLSQVDQDYVVAAKVTLPLTFLKTGHDIMEENHFYQVGDRIERETLNRYCARPNTFKFYPFTKMVGVNREVMDDHWGRWINRRDFSRYLDEQD